jgi:CHAT domain-containing protein/lipopolysaccharide biosynthesis regulator YciM
MSYSLQWLKLVPLIALLWGWPFEVRAQLSGELVKQASVGQTTARKQNDGQQQNVLFRIEGELTADDAQLEDGSLHDVHLFEGEAGQIVRILLMSEAFDTFLILQDASQNELALNDDGSDDTNAEIVFRLPTSGQYRIIANAFDESGKGAYQLTVEGSDENALRQVDLRAEADRLLDQGIDSLQISQYREALNSWQTALEIYRELDDRQGEANALNNLGIAYESLGDYQQAIDFQQQSLAMARNLGDRQGEASSLGNLGNAYYSLGDYQQAIDFHQQSLAMARNLGDRQGEASSLGNLGNAYYSLGDYQQAIDFHQQSLAIARDLGNRQGEASSFGGLGNAYQSLGDYQQAIDFHQQYLAIARDLGNRQGEASSFGGLGNAYQSLGDYQQAIDFHQQHLALVRDLGDRQGEALSLGNLGNAYQSLGDYQQAIDFHQQSLAIARDLGNRQGEADSLGNLGNAYQSLGDYQQAIDFHQQYLAITHNLGDRQGEAISLNNLGVIYENLGDYQQATDFYQQSLAIARDLGNRQGEALSLNNLGDAWAAQNQSELAIIFYKDAVNVYETIRTDITDLSQELQASYTTSVEGTYRSLTDLLLSQGRILEAQQVLELLKVEELREFTRATYTTEGLQYDPIEQPVIDAHGSLIQLGANISACHPDCEQSLYDQQIALEGYFDQTVKTFEETIRTNRAEDDVFYDPNNFASDALDIVNAQDGTVLIYPVVLEDTLWLLWTATGGVVGSIEVPETNQAEISRAVVRFRELLTQKDPQSLEELKQVGQQLHSWLIEPLSEELKKNNIQHLVFAQDRATRYLPMVALYDGEQFLIENYTVSTVLSAALTDTTDRLGEVSTVSTLGLGLDQSVSGFNSLPNVREELEAVVKEGENDTSGIYPGSIFMNEAFTFNTLSEQVRRYRILHIATHAEFVPNIRDASYILSGTGEKLTIDQIGALDTLFDYLHLVVLSACQTALGGESLDGTEIAGISSYFLGKNKAEAVLATLWRVDDTGTSLLMQRFYEILATGQVTKAEALRQAQLSLLYGEATLDERLANLALEGSDRGLALSEPPEIAEATLDHPYYWAPFILIGNSL